MGEQKSELDKVVSPPNIDKATQARLERFRNRSEKQAAEQKQTKEKKRRKFFDAL